MRQKKLLPDYIFESSWEVCNKVGGIYTVLSTRAKTLQDAMPDRVIFIGPDFWQGKDNPLFVEDKKLLANWRRAALKENLSLRIGRWQIPGHPVVVLVPSAMTSTELSGLISRWIPCTLTATMTRLQCSPMLPDVWLKATTNSS